jgi:long-chain acyl-CoA synthetase
MLAEVRTYAAGLSRLGLIADSGEVQFKSPGMFIGYFRDEAKTAEALTPDGFVKTGDVGFVDRAKDVGRLTDDTPFAPKYIENKLKFFPNFRKIASRLPD